ncbi:MAG TPA: hypothetical protein VGA56_00275 [Opitutaceae bacterium]
MFGTKSKIIFIDIFGESAYAASASSQKAPMVVEALREVSLPDESSLPDALRSLSGLRGAGLVPASCSIYPTGRIVASAAVDPKRVGEEAYLAETVRETLKIDSSRYNLYMLSPADGSDVTQSKGSMRDVLICGAPTEELALRQDDLVKNGCFPLRFEIGTIATLGGVIDYLQYSESRMPTLLLEIGKDTTGVFILTSEGVQISRSIQFGIDSMIPQVQKELALKDEEAARRLFFSNSFDFTGLGGQLTKRLVRELQASIGFFEVQTGLSVSQICCTLIPSKVSWLDNTLADVLGMRVLSADYRGWLKARGIELSPGCAEIARGAGWMGLFSLMVQHREKQNETAA